MRAFVQLWQSLRAYTLHLGSQWGTDNKLHSELLKMPFKREPKNERLVWGFLYVLNFSQLLLSLNSWRWDGGTSMAPCWNKRNTLFLIYSLQLSFLPYMLKTNFVIDKGGDWQGKFFRNKLLPLSGQGPTGAFRPWQQLVLAPDLHWGLLVSVGSRSIFTAPKCSSPICKMWEHISGKNLTPKHHFLPVSA